MKEFLKKYWFMLVLVLVFVGMVVWGWSDYKPTLPIIPEAQIEIITTPIPAAEVVPTIKVLVTKKSTVIPKPTATVKPKVIKQTATQIVKAVVKPKEKENPMWFLILVQTAEEFVKANVYLVGMIIAFVAWLKSFQPKISWLKDEYLTISAFLVSFLLIWGGPGSVIETQLMANAIALGISATGLYKGATYIALKGNSAVTNKLGETVIKKEGESK